MNFTLKGYVFGPVKSGKIIKFANSVFYAPAGIEDGELSMYIGNSSPVAFLQTRPGLTDEGKPTSNAALSIDTDLITATSDFGYITDNTNVST
jgi:hypothetical protein